MFICIAPFREINTNIQVSGHLHRIRSSHDAVVARVYQLTPLAAWMTCDLDLIAWLCLVRDTARLCIHCCIYGTCWAQCFPSCTFQLLNSISYPNNVIIHTLHIYIKSEDSEAIIIIVVLLVNSSLVPAILRPSSCNFITDLVGSFRDCVVWNQDSCQLQDNMWKFQLCSVKEWKWQSLKLKLKVWMYVM